MSKKNEKNGKLAVKKETLVVLTPNDLTRVVGGAIGTFSRSACCGTN